MMQQYPNYSDCLVNLSRSVLNAFGLPCAQTMQDLDPLLAAPKNVVLFLLDGMGTAILERHLAPEGFFRRHLVRSYSSVFPPTTVAATTSVQSALEPVEHSWLGWDCYYPALEQNVTVFTGKRQSTNIPAADFDPATTLCPYRSIVERINESGGQAYFATPFNDPRPKSLEAICQRIAALCALPERKFIYAYWNEPDSTMHATGVASAQSRAVLQDLERKMAALCRSLPDTLVILTADHGQVDGRSLVITDYPDITECLLRMPSIEPRALNFYVKEGMQERFRTAFSEHFGQDFLLLTHQQVLEQKLFGEKTPHPDFDAMLGDFLAIGIGNISLFCTREEADAIIGAHAGLCAEEMTIPLIICQGGCAHE